MNNNLIYDKNNIISGAYKRREQNIIILSIDYQRAVIDNRCFKRHLLPKTE